MGSAASLRGTWLPDGRSIRDGRRIRPHETVASRDRHLAREERRYDATDLRTRGGLQFVRMGRDVAVVRAVAAVHNAHERGGGDRLDRPRLPHPARGHPET